MLKKEGDELTNNTAKNKIKCAIESHDAQNRAGVKVNAIKFKGIKKWGSGIEIEQVIISIDDAMSVHLCDILGPLNELEESDNIIMINKLIEC